MNKKYASLVTLVVVLAMVGAAWWLNRGVDTTRSGPPPKSESSRGTTANPTAKRSTPGPGGEKTDPESRLPFVEASALPKEAQQVLAQIDRGGPYAYARDGSTFGNLEGRLPKQARGFYKEYTVRTPGESDRGARRIVTGAKDTVFYWTDDHYETFSRVRR